MKRFDRIVGAQVLSRVHNLVLANGAANYPFASLYYDPRYRITGLPHGMSHV
jgi:hypothetical protein